MVDVSVPDLDVSVALATYNGAKYLRPLLESCFNQTLGPVELVASDDRSTDETAAILEGYSRERRITILVNTGRGFVANFNNALLACDAEYIALADQDDVWRLDKLEILSTRLKSIEARVGKDVPILIFSDLEIVDEGLNTIARSFFRSGIKSPEASAFRDFVLGGNIPGCAMMINRALRDRALPIPAVPSHDWWLLLVASAFGVVEHVPESLIKYRQHGQNAIGLGGFGQSTSLRLMSAALSPGRFLSARYRNTNVHWKKIYENLLEFTERYWTELKHSDRELIDEMNRPGNFFTKARLFDRRKAGFRTVDFLLLMGLMSQSRPGVHRPSRAPDGL